MRVATLTEFAASKKEALSELIGRVHQAFLDAGLGEPGIQFNFGDAPTRVSTSIVERVLKRHPELERFVTGAAPMPGIPGARRISNGPRSPAAGEAVPFSVLQAIAAGVPRSFPLHSIALHFHAPPFGDLAGPSEINAQMIPGVLVTDSWWVNGRNRSLTACAIVEADAGSKKLPPPAATVAAVLAACGKARRTVQAPLAAAGSAGHVPQVRLPTGMAIPSADPEAAARVQAIVVDYRSRLREIVDRARLPHDLPPPGPEALAGAGLEVLSGPRKPALERAFQPLGYRCLGATGSFDLRRRTAGNLTVELHLDVAPWGGSVLAMFRVLGVGFKATLGVPVSATAIPAGQYPIGDADRWRKIVENLAALVAELDRSFVPEVEAAAGPSPEWYQPDS